MELQVGVKVLLRNERGEILLLKRSEKYGEVSGRWDIPGGRIDPGSTLRENLDREIFEETQLKLTDSGVTLIAAQDIMPNQERHIVRLTYVGNTSGEPKLDLVEHSEYKWVTFEELSQEPGLDTYVRELIDTGILQEDSGKL